MAPRKRRNSGGKSEGRRDTRVSDVRRAVRRVSRDDLYSPQTGFLHGKYDTEKVYAWFQRQHKASAVLIDDDGYFHSGEHRWRVPYGVRLCLRKPLLWTHMVKRQAWFVTWKSPKTGQRLRKYFASPWHGLVFITEKVQYVDPHAALVNRNGYDIPAKLRGKIPLPYKWCPRCMTARRFKAVRPQETFHAMRKEWNDDKEKYEYKDRELRLLHCPQCGLTNRDSTMRRSNQPWEKRVFKKGVRRARRRRPIP
jgi:hypothetical protein